MKIAVLKQNRRKLYSFLVAAAFAGLWWSLLALGVGVFDSYTFRSELYPHVIAFSTASLCIAIGASQQQKDKSILKKSCDVLLTAILDFVVMVVMIGVIYIVLLLIHQ